MIRAALLFVLGAAGLGCDPKVVFACETRDDCVDGAAAGVCEPDGYCSFPDDACESGRRYGGYAPPTVAGTCTPVHDVDPGVLVGVAESTTSSSSSSSDSTTTPLSSEGGDTTGAGSSEDGTSELPETTRGSSSSVDDLDTGTDSSSTGDRDPQDCNALECADCMDCVALPSGPCEDELDACTNANGCQSDVACNRECMLYGWCFDDCCLGDVGPLVDELVLCAADHCIDACGEYEFLTCG